MKLYRTKPGVIQAITFDELVQHGIDSGAPLHNGMPWSFRYQGWQITHESDDCYLIPTLTGTKKMHRGDTLVVLLDGALVPFEASDFEASFEEAPPDGGSGT